MKHEETASPLPVPTVPCIDCGRMVSYAGDQLLAALPALRRMLTRPAARCGDCYAEWQGRMRDEARVELQQFRMGVLQYLQREGRLPPPEVEREIIAGAFGDQWRQVKDEWQRRRAAERAARTGGRHEEAD